MWKSESFEWPGFHPSSEGTKTSCALGGKLKVESGKLKVESGNKLKVENGKLKMLSKSFFPLSHFATVPP